MIFLLPTLSSFRTNSLPPLLAWRSGFPVPSWAVRFIFVVYPVLVFFFLMNLKLNFSQFSTILNPVPCCQQHFPGNIFFSQYNANYQITRSSHNGNIFCTRCESSIAAKVLPTEITFKKTKSAKDKMVGKTPQKTLAGQGRLQRWVRRLLRWAKYGEKKKHKGRKRWGPTILTSIEPSCTTHTMGNMRELTNIAIFFT